MIKDFLRSTKQLPSNSRDKRVQDNAVSHQILLNIIDIIYTSLHIYIYIYIYNIYWYLSHSQKMFYTRAKKILKQKEKNIHLGSQIADLLS